MTEPMPVNMTNYLEQYTKEWEKENGCGDIVREFAAHTGLSIGDALNYLHWLEQLRYNAIVAANAEKMAEMIPLQIKVLKDHERECGDDKPPWEST